MTADEIDAHRLARALQSRLVSEWLALIHAARADWSMPGARLNLMLAEPMARAIADEYAKAIAGAWPTREEFRKMSAYEVNEFFASIGVDWRVKVP